MSRSTITTTRSARTSPAHASGRGAASGRTTAYPVPVAPTSPSATATSPSAITVSWTDTNSGRAPYKVERSPNGSTSWSQIGTTATGATSYGDSGLSANTTYYYRVRANASGFDSSYCSTVNATTGTTPAAASSLTATAVSSSEIDLTWTDNQGSGANAETGFKVQRSPDGSTSWATLVTTAANVTSYNNTGLSSTTTYYYRVVATNTAGDASPSNVASDTTLNPSAPGTPTNLTATSMLDTANALTWDRADDTDTSIQVWRGPHAGTLTLLDTLPARENVYNDHSCAPATVYDYHIVAVNGSGSSSASVTATATTKATGATRAAPTSVSVSALSSYSLQVQFTDPNDGGTSRQFMVERASVDGSGNVGAFQVVQWVRPAVVGGVTTWKDGELADNSALNLVASYDFTPLSPNTTYAYRIRCTTADPSYGEYCTTVTGTTNSRPVGQPAEPSGLTVTPTTGTTAATSATVSFTDNSGGAAQHEVYTAPVPGAGYPYSATWTLKATLATGVTTYALTTTAENAYYVRIRAKNGSNFSGYTSPALYVSPSTPNVSGPQTYDIGPGQASTTIGGFNWGQVGPGDTVRIHGMNSGATATPYFEKFLIKCRGTQVAPITVVGVNDANGNRCVIDGTNATTNSQFLYPSGTTYQDISLVIFSYYSTSSNGYRPGWITFSNFEVRNAYQGDVGSPANQYTTNTGATSYYGGNATATGNGSAGGIVFTCGDNITIDSCVVHGNGNGIFGDDQGGFGGNAHYDLQRLENLTIQANYVYGNGTYDPGASPTNYRQHGSYIECRNITYQYNRYGDGRTGAAGAALKDRSHGTVIRFNFFDGAAVRCDLVEAQNHDGVAVATPAYRKTFFYGNVVSNLVNADASVVVYGGDSDQDASYRQGILYSAHNTYGLLTDASVQSRVKLWTGALNNVPTGFLVDSRNDVFYVASPDAQTVSPTYYFAKDGVLRFGSGWATNTIGTAYDGTGNAAVKGSAHLLDSTGNAPNFTNAASDDFRPTVSSPFRSAGVALAGSMPGSCNVEYVMHQSHQSRPDGGGLNTDMGYYQQGT